MKNKTREQLTRELARLRKQIAELKKSKTERNQIAKELQTTRKQIELVLGATKTGVDIIDSKFNMKYINAEWQKIYGNPEGKKCYKYFMGRNKACPNCAIPKAIKTKKPVITEEILVKENNRPIQVTTIPFKDRNGEWLVAEVNVDVTERKKAEEVLRESESRFKMLFIGAPEGILAADLQTKRFRYANPSVCRMFGYTEEEFLRIGVADIHPKESLKHVLAEFEDGKPLSTEFPCLHKNGTLFYVSISGVGMVLDGRKHNVGFFTDITERRKAEETRKNLTAIIEATPDFVGFADAKDKHIIYMNKAGRKICGVGNDEDVTKLKIRDVHPKWTNKMLAEKALPAAARDGAWNGECAFLNIRNKHEIPVSMVLSSHKNSNGEVEVFSTISRDITERKRLDDELEKHREHLEELVRRRTGELETVNRIIRKDIVACNIMGEELRKSEKRYRELWDDAPVAYHTIDTKGIITNVNKTEAKMLGYDPKEMIGKSIFDFILPEQREEAQKRFQQKLSGKHLLKAESRIYAKKDGSKIYVLIDDILEHDSDKKVIGMRTTMVDFTESKKMEEALRESEVQYRTTINSIADPIHVVDADLRVILFNNAFQKMLKDMGLKTESVTGQILFDVLPFLSDKARNEYKKVFESGEDLITEEQVNIGGREFIAEVRKIPIWEDTKVVRVLTFIRDITERRKAEETIRHLAYYDALTNLPNRMLFNNRLALELSRAQRNQQKASVMMLDIDKFKDVNDKLGHSFGDQLLQSVGQRLIDTVRLSDTIARMGGDEFILLLPEIVDEKDAVKIAEKILDTMRKPFMISGQELHATISIGISIFPSHGEDAETLIKNADIAMYKAKESGRDRYSLYGSNPSLPIPF